ncbi:hypothetical protein [Pseudoduganella sp. OTU4001]|uniref:hypothetical protein n=1 Tax=Pseudoduganella sp. OTU4001 TaxID=3043854 RepID=UPI00313E330A
MLQNTAITSMSKFSFLASAVTLWGAAHAQQEIPPEFKPIQGRYMTYSLGLGDPAPAKRHDSKIAFAVSGDAARKMFDAMAPDVHDICTAGSGVRVRTKENVSCQREKDGSFHCSFGFDLRTGKSIGGSVC